MREQSIVADGMRIDWDVPIEMDDGIVLRADVYRPVEAGQYPVILSYGPYGKNLPLHIAHDQGYDSMWANFAAAYPESLAGTSTKYVVWEVVDPELWVPDGYACVRVDARGAGRSPGVVDSFSPREARDAYNCVEWAAAQPWSSGKVGITGTSYHAIIAWLTAALQPPHLAAILPWEGQTDAYRERERHGGIFCIFMSETWWNVQLDHLQHGIGQRGTVDPNSGLLTAGPETLTDEELRQNRVDTAAHALAHPLDDEYWRARAADLSKITVPFLTAANWGGQGLHPRGSYEAFVGAASEQKWLEVHGLGHWTLFYHNYGRDLQKRFFDHFLRGADNGWDKEPPVRLQVRHVDKFVERFEHEWPLARTQWTRLYLDPSCRMLQWEPVAAEGQLQYRALSEGVRLLTAPFEAETEITGPLALKLFLASSTVDADVFAVVQLFDPTGKEIDFKGGGEDPHTPIAHGWLRASQRKLDPERSRPYRPYHPHDEEQLLIRGEVFELDVEIWPTCIVVPPGYRLGLTLLGKDFERPGPASQVGKFVIRGSAMFLHTNPQDRPADIFDNVHTVYGGGERESYLLLPVIPPRA